MSTSRYLSTSGFVACLAVFVTLLVAAAPASGATVWPGGGDVAVADAPSALGNNVSGLAHQASVSAVPGVLWAVRNGPSTLYRLVWDGARWAPDPTGGWATGKRLTYGDGTGDPDAEGVTIASDDPSSVYVATERNNAAGQSGTSRPSVLRFDVSSPAATLAATQEFNLAADMPGLAANQGPEAIAWMPDSSLVSKGFRDETADAPYDPAALAGHGTGLFFVGVEQTGQIVAYVLDGASGEFTRVATVASSLPHVMALEWEPDSGSLWAVCDNSCGGGHTVLGIAQSGPYAGRFVAANAYDRPTGMPNLNNEGFAIAPQASCVNGSKPAFWADDGETGANALRAGTLSCATPALPPAFDPGAALEGPAPLPDTTVDGSVTAKGTQIRNGRITIEITVAAGEALSVKATGRINAGKSHRLKTNAAQVAAGTSNRLILKPANAKSARVIARAMACKRIAKAVVTIELTDRAANVASKTVKANLNPD